jgi:hypothetical protein
MSTYRVDVNGQADDRRNDEPTAEEIRETPPIQSTAELREVMKSEHYKTSSLARKLVVESLRKSAPNVGAIQSQVQGQPVDVGNELEAKMDATKQLFRDPRYKTSALYRKQVAELIQQQNEPVQPGDVQRVGFSRERGKFAQQEGISTIRVEFETQVSGPDKPAPKAPKPRDPNTIDLF